MTSKAATVGDIIDLMEHLAPPRLAESWDPIGLQVGDRGWPVNRIWVALDPLPAVISAACREHVDLLITHHPLIYKPLQNLDCGRHPGSLLCTALEHRLAVYAAHTNYDSAIGGLNDVLAERLGLRGMRALQPYQPDAAKLAAYVPRHCEAAALDIVLAAGAERIESRSAELVRAQPDDAIGGKAIRDRDPVCRIDARLRRAHLHTAVEGLRTLRGCEQVPLEVFAVEMPAYAAATGLGRIAALEPPRSLAELARQVKTQLDCGYVKVAGNPAMTVDKVAICSGSGAGLLKAFLASDAQVYITGDFKYHEAREIEAAGRGLIDAGHFATEHIMASALARRLERRLKVLGLPVAVEACELETDVFTFS